MLFEILYLYFFFFLLKIKNYIFIKKLTYFKNNVENEDCSKHNFNNKYLYFKMGKLNKL